MFRGTNNDTYMFGTVPLNDCNFNQKVQFKINSIMAEKSEKHTHLKTKSIIR